MIFSRAVPVGEVKFPEFTGIQVHMRQMTLVRYHDNDRTYFEGVPDQYQALVFAMLHASTEDYARINGDTRWGELYITIDERDIPAGESHRRGGVHYDGVYFIVQDKDPRWNTINSSAITNGAGMILAASHMASQGWRGTLLGQAGPGGDCDHMRSQLPELERFDLEANVVYHGNATFIHESLPVAEPTRRQLVRITYSK